MVQCAQEIECRVQILTYGFSIKDSDWLSFVSKTLIGPLLIADLSNALERKRSWK